MGEHQVIPMNRPDVVDTSGMTQFMVQIDAGRAREGRTMPDELAMVIGRLAMGQAVQRSVLARWGVRALEIREFPPVAPDPGQAA